MSTRTHYDHYTRFLSPACNEGRKQIAEQVIDRLSRPDSHADGPNEITAALRSRFREFVLTPEMIDPSEELPLIHGTCNPSSPTGDLGCRLGTANALPSECVYGPSGGGECRFYAPISRVEMTPSGVEIVLLEQPKNDNGLITGLINDYVGSGPDDILFNLKQHHCAAPDESPTHTSSRTHERATRGNPATLFSSPDNTSLD